MKFFLVFVLTIILACLASGQSIKLTGTVYNPGGALVTGADIKALNEKGIVTTGISDSNGEFVVSVAPGIYAIDVSAPGFLTIKYKEFLVVNSTNGKMIMDFVMFGGNYHEPCGVSGGDCLPAELLIKSYKVEYSPSLKKIRDRFSPETKPKNNNK